MLWQQLAGSEEENFLVIKFDQHPLDNPNVDLRLGLDMKSLNIYLNMSCVNKIGSHSTTTRALYSSLIINLLAVCSLTLQWASSDARHLVLSTTSRCRYGRVLQA
jgi:hypothetical protein